MASIYLPGVIHQRQLNPRACWYTCLQMEVYYFQNQSQSCPSDLTPPEDFSDMQQRFSQGSNPSWAEWRAWGQRCGFSPMDMTPNANGIYSTLSQRGPIIYSGTWGNSFDGHVVIITGIDTDNSILYIDDPLDTSAPTTKDVNTYLSQLTQTLYENPLFVY